MIGYVYSEDIIQSFLNLLYECQFNHKFFNFTNLVLNIWASHSGKFSLEYGSMLRKMAGMTRLSQ